MEIRRVHIAGLGVACIDYIVVAPHAPPGSATSVLDYTVQGGGLTGTALVACSRLGAQATMLGRLGDDEIGEKVIEGLIEENVECSGMIRVRGGQSLFSWILVDAETAERTIYCRADSGLDCLTDLIPLDKIADADALLVDDLWLDGAIAAARKAREAGIPVVCDLAIRESNVALVELCTHAVIPRSSAMRLADGDIGAAMAKVLDMGPDTVVVTCGPDGAHYVGVSGEGHVPAFRVEAVDTTGAGDVFHGAFAFGLAQGWALRDTIVFASAVSAIKCTRLGGRVGIPSLDQTMEFLRWSSQASGSGV